MSKSRSNDLPAIADRLYAGMTDSRVWSDALIACADLTQSKGLALFAFNPLSGAVLRDEVHRLDMELSVRYRTYWSAHDTRMDRGFEIPVGEPIYEGRLMDLRDWRKSEIFNEFLSPRNLPYMLAYSLHKSSNKLILVSLQASHRRGPFDQRDAERLAPLVPHIQRAFKIRDRLEACEIRASNLATLLSRTSFGVFLLDEVGKILETNTRAEELLRTESTLRKEADHSLWLFGGAGNELQRWIAAGRPSDNFTEELLRVPRFDARQPLSVMVSPLHGIPTGWLSSHPRRMVLVFDAEQQLAAMPAVLCAQFGLTTKEAELASLLALGINLESAAQRMNIKFHTARSHLKSIFAKTGVHSQSELVRQVMVGPATYVRSNT